MNIIIIILILITLLHLLLFVPLVLEIQAQMKFVLEKENVLEIPTSIFHRTRTSLECVIVMTVFLVTIVRIRVLHATVAEQFAKPVLLLQLVLRRTTACATIKQVFACASKDFLGQIVPCQLVPLEATGKSVQVTVFVSLRILLVNVFPILQRREFGTELLVKFVITIILEARAMDANRDVR